MFTVLIPFCLVKSVFFVVKELSKHWDIGLALGFYQVMRVSEESATPAQCDGGRTGETPCGRGFSVSPRGDHVEFT